MAGTHVIYQTPTGQNASGYIIDGKTYKDPEGKERIEIGSTVPTAGGTYTYTAAGSVKTPVSVAEDIRGAYAASEGHLANSLSAKKSGIESATNRKISSIDASKKAADKTYADLNRKAYSSYLSAANPYGALGEQRARLGLANSGYAESSNMKIANAYQQNIAENERHKQEYLNELENARRDAQYQGDIEKANAIAEYEMLVYKHGIDAAEAIANQQNRAYEAGISANDAVWNKNMEERAYADSKAETLIDLVYKYAMKGYSNSQIARRLGISESELNERIGRFFA